MKPQQTNIAILQKLRDNVVALSWDYDGARYHMWIDPRDMTHDGPLYKNPPQHVKMGDPGYFNSKSLNPDAKHNRAMIEHAKKTARLCGLHDVFLLDEKRERAEEERRNAIARAVRDCQAAGPQLLRIVKELLPLAENTFDGHAFNLQYHDECGAGCPVVDARALILMLETKTNGAKS